MSDPASAPFSFIGLDHVVIRCRDITKMRSFYKDTLGMPEERVLTEVGLYQYRAGMSLIDLVDCSSGIGAEGGAPPAEDGSGHNMAHLCLRIADMNWDQLIAYLRQKGISIDDASGRRYGADGYGHSIYMSDPEGNLVEFKMSPDEGPIGT